MEFSDPCGEIMDTHRGLRLRNAAEWQSLRRDFVWKKTK